MPDWLTIARGDAPLIVSMPHTGMEIPLEIEAGLVSPWLARKDADWHVDKLYDFAPGLGITTIRTAISRTVIDVNRDPSGKSLYPGQATTELCPTKGMRQAKPRSPDATSAISIPITRPSQPRSRG
jgi:formiminoglutamase